MPNRISTVTGARRAAIALAAALLLSGCIGTSGTRDAERPAPPPPPPPASNAVELSTGDVIDIGGLPGQQLAPGECGLFLFAAKPTARFVFFSSASKGTGLMQINGDLVTLARTRADGGVIDQHFTDQSFRAPAQGITISLTITPGEAMTGGHRIDGGALRLVRDDGWSMVVPVAGATTCGE